MSRLSQLSGRDVTRELARAGCAQDHVRGSHVVLRQVNPPHRRPTVPNHNPIATVTVRAIIRQAGLTVDEFLALL